jgi:hypothetical protein
MYAFYWINNFRPQRRKYFQGCVRHITLTKLLALPCASGSVLIMKVVEPAARKLPMRLPVACSGFFGEKDPAARA